ncbi:MAG: hypothetical protein JST84_04815 [Acidobacteria bacterium]|nr:hypothetical protein [Acidobacteriota bacterium]
MKIKALFFLCLICGVFLLQAFAQTATPAGTVISNTAKYTYTDPAANTHNGTSNTVTVTVLKVAGITITPDAGTVPNLVPGQSATLTFTLTNTGNYPEVMTFPAAGAGAVVSGPVTVTAMFADTNGNGVLDAGETNLLTSTTTPSLNPNISLPVVVKITANAAATPGASVSVTLGDATTGSPSFDNQPNVASANGITTTDATAVNGIREALGSITTAIEKDAMIAITLTAPTGPVTVGDTMTYTLQDCNSGNRAATSITLPGAPVAAATGVFIFAPIPNDTVLRSGQTFPAGTLYTTDPLSVAPTAAAWTTTPPATLASVTRIAFNIGNSLAAGACTAIIPFDVVVQPTASPSRPISIIADTFATNSLNQPITDQSGDAAPNAGDGNANFNEGPAAGTIDGNGVIQTTPVTVNVSVLNGPAGTPGATGPTSNNDDYTNKSQLTGIQVPSGNTTAAATIVFNNTLQNTGNSNDSFVLSTPTVPAGSTVEISLDGGTTWTTVSGGATVTTGVLAPNATQNYQVRVTIPTGQSVLTGFDTIIKATSTNDPTKSNNTIDRIYTGYLKLVKTSSISNSTGIGAATDPVPGAQIIYNVQYSNLASTGGTGSVTLNATNIVITEDGNAAPNNWGSTTTQVVGSATDTNSGTLTGDVAGSSVLTDTVASLAAGASGTFSFKRMIK